MNAENQQLDRLEKHLEYVICAICNKKLNKMTWAHLKTHNITFQEYGNKFPTAKFTTEYSLNKQKVTSRKHFGVDNPSQSSIIQQKKEDTCMKNFGVRHPMQSDEVWRKSREATKANLGVEFPTQSEQVKQKRVETWQANLGVDNPQQHQGVRQKVRDTCLAKYGVKAPFLQDWVKQKSQASLEHKQTGPERYIEAITSNEVIYIGRRGLSFRMLDSSLKFPDFLIVPHNNLDTSVKIMEYFGEYWHDEKITGLSRCEHEQQIIEQYASIGVQCLVIWDVDLQDEERLLEKIEQFIQSDSSETIVYSSDTIDER